MQAILDAVELTNVASWASTIGVAIIGIALVFKGVDLAKRGVRKA